LAPLRKLFAPPGVPSCYGPAQFPSESELNV